MFKTVVCWNSMRFTWYVKNIFSEMKRSSSATNWRSVINITYDAFLCSVHLPCLWLKNWSDLDGAHYMLTCWVKLSADDILKYFSYFPWKQVLTFHANCLMKCQVLFKVYTQKNIMEFVICWISPESGKGYYYKVYHVSTSFSTGNSFLFCTDCFPSNCHISVLFYLIPLELPEQKL